MSQSLAYHVVEETDIAGIIPQLVDVLGATRETVPRPRRFEWLYLENPAGPATVWTLRRGETNEIVGFTACLPREVSVHGRIRRCWIGSDFSILPKYRSLGLALKLRRAARIAIDEGRCEFLYSHPNDRMAVIHEQVGHKPVGQMVRLARLLSVKPLLQERKSTRLLAGAAALVIDPVLGAVGSDWRSPSRGDVSHEAQPTFGDEFDDLFAREQNSVPVVGVRNAKYLNWRYRDNPLATYQILRLEREGRLAGYLVFQVSESDQSLIVQDIFPAHDAGLARKLLSALWRVGRARRDRSLSMSLLSSSSLLPVLRRKQYFPRAETSRMFYYAPEAASDLAVLSSAKAWHICAGDRDV